VQVYGLVARNPEAGFSHWEVVSNGSLDTQWIPVSTDFLLMAYFATSRGSKAPGRSRVAWVLTSECPEVHIVNLSTDETARAGGLVPGTREYNFATRFSEYHILRSVPPRACREVSLAGCVFNRQNCPFQEFKDGMPELTRRFLEDLPRASSGGRQTLENVMYLATGPSAGTGDLLRSDDEEPPPVPERPWEPLASGTGGAGAGSAAASSRQSF